MVTWMDAFETAHGALPPPCKACPSPLTSVLRHVPAYAVVHPYLAHLAIHIAANGTPVSLLSPHALLRTKSHPLAERLIFCLFSFSAWYLHENALSFDLQPEATGFWTSTLSKLLLDAVSH
jgi:hypothetical protein